MKNQVIKLLENELRLTCENISHSKRVLRVTGTDKIILKIYLKALAKNEKYLDDLGAAIKILNKSLS